MNLDAIKTWAAGIPHQFADLLGYNKTATITLAALAFLAGCVLHH